MPAKKRCQHAGAPCPNAAVRIVGTCSHCSHHFCASVSRLPPLMWIAVANIPLWVNSTDYLSSMHAPSSPSASVRRLRRTGPSSSRRVPSRARWRSCHEAASVAYQSINPNLAVYILFHLTLSHTASTPSPLPTAQPRCNHPNATISSLPATFISSRLVYPHLDYLASYFNPISHLYTFSRDAMSFPFRATYPSTLQPHNPSAALYHGTSITSFPHCSLMSCFASLAAVIEEMALVPKLRRVKRSYRSAENG